MRTAAPDRDDEEARQAALRAYAILDTEREPAFDDIVAMAARACGTPVAYLNFIDRRRQWLKAEVGLGRREMPAEGSLCVAALAGAATLLVPDIDADPSAAAAVEGVPEPRPRFYAGVPLRTPEGVAIGTLCVVDTRPRALGAEQLFILEALARSAMAQLDLRRALRERDAALEGERRAEAGRRRGEALSRQVLDSAVDYAIVSTDLGGRVTGWN